MIQYQSEKALIGKLKGAVQNPKEQPPDQTIIAQAIFHDYFIEATQLIKCFYPSLNPIPNILAQRLSSPILERHSDFFKLLFLVQKQGFELLPALFMVETIPNENLSFIGEICVFKLRSDRCYSSITVHPSFSHYFQKSTLRYDPAKVFLSVDFLLIKTQEEFANIHSQKPLIQARPSGEFIQTRDRTTIVNFTSWILNSLNQLQADNSQIIASQLKRYMSTFFGSSGELKKRLDQHKISLAVSQLDQLRLKDITTSGKEISTEFLAPLKTARSITDLNAAKAKLEARLSDPSAKSIKEAEAIFLAELTAILDTFKDWPNGAEKMLEQLRNFDTAILSFEKTFSMHYSSLYSLGIKYPKLRQENIGNPSYETHKILVNLGEVLNYGKYRFYCTILEQIHRLDSMAFLGVSNEKEDQILSALFESFQTYNEICGNITKFFSDMALLWQKYEDFQLKSELLGKLKPYQNLSPNEVKELYVKRLACLHEIEEMWDAFQKESPCLVCRKRRAFKICAKCNRKVVCQQCSISNCPICGTHF